MFSHIWTHKTERYSWDSPFSGCHGNTFTIATQNIWNFNQLQPYLERMSNLGKVSVWVFCTAYELVSISKKIGWCCVWDNIHLTLIFLVCIWCMGMGLGIWHEYLGLDLNWDLNWQVGPKLLLLYYTQGSDLGH